MEPNIVLDTLAVTLDRQPIDEWQALEQTPEAGPTPTVSVTTGTAELGHLAGVDYGLWEMSAGQMRDIEADEIFVVLSGTGRIDFDEPAREPITLEPGTLVRLGEGMRTRWTVDGEALRKLYISPSAG